MTRLGLALALVPIASCVAVVDDRGDATGDLDDGDGDGGPGGHGPGGEPAPAGRTCAATGSTASAVVEPVGAVADDGLDDRAAIQAAIDAAEGGGVVLLPPGTFVVGRALIVRSGVALRGAGPDTVIAAGDGFLAAPHAYGGYPVVTTDGATDVTIADLMVDQRGDELDGNVEGRLNEFAVDVRLSENAMVDGVHVVNPFTYAIAVVGSTHFCVRRSSTRVTSVGRYDQLDGVHILDSSAGFVLDNDLDQGGPEADGDDAMVAHTIGAPVTDVVYARNRARGGRGAAAMQIAPGAFGIGRIAIENNELWGSPAGLHSRYWDDAAPPVESLAIGGSPGTGNLFRDNAAFAVELDGELRDVVVSHNVSCRSGEFTAVPGDAVVVDANQLVDDCP